MRRRMLHLALLVWALDTLQVQPPEGSGLPVLSTAATITGDAFEFTLEQGEYDLTAGYYARGDPGTISDGGGGRSPVAAAASSLR